MCTVNLWSVVGIKCTIRERGEREREREGREKEKGGGREGVHDNNDTPLTYTQNQT